MARNHGRGRGAACSSLTSCLGRFIYGPFSLLLLFFLAGVFFPFAWKLSDLDFPPLFICFLGFGSGKWGRTLAPGRSGRSVAVAGMGAHEGVVVLYFFVSSIGE